MAACASLSPGADEAELLVEQGTRVDRRRRDGVVDDAHVDAADEQPLVDGRRQALDDGERAAGKALPELAHDRHGKVPRDRGRKRDDDMADRRVLGLVDLAPRPGHLLQDAARVLEQALARLGRRGAPPVAQQQVLAQLHLEAAYLPADRRLGDRRARRPARLNPPRSTTFTKYSSCFRSMRTSRRFRRLPVADADTA